MANTKISALTALTGTAAELAADVVAVVDTSVTTTKKMVLSELAIAMFKSVVNQLFDISGVSGGQIKFPATQNASADVHTLDDYEEGSFAPALQFGGAAVGMTYGTQSGTYVKVGKIVHINGIITLTAKGSSTGAVSIAGLPFTSATFSVIGARLSVLASSVGPTTLLVNTSSTSMSLQQLMGTDISNVTDAELSDTTTIVYGGSYMAAA